MSPVKSSYGDEDDDGGPDGDDREGEEGQARHNGKYQGGTFLNQPIPEDPSHISFTSDASSLHHSNAASPPSDFSFSRRQDGLAKADGIRTIVNQPSDDSLVWADASMEHEPELPSLEIPSSPPDDWRSDQTAASPFDDGTPHATNTSSLETMSSPTAAAAARTITRAISMATIGGYETADDRSPERRPRPVLNSSDEEITPKRMTLLAPNGSLNGRVHTIRSKMSFMDLHDPESPVVTDSVSSGLSSSKRRRTGFIKGRAASKRSSKSSTDTLGSTDGKDLVHPSAPAESINLTESAQTANLARSASQKDLVRSISLGSIASGVGSVAESDSGYERGRGRNISNDTEEPAASLSPLAEEVSSPLVDTEETPQPSVIARNAPEASSSIPVTPSLGHSTFQPPTATALAQRVSEVQVPMTAARRFQSMNRTPSTESRSTTASGRANRHHSLKEQTAIIERLSKENFNLKLKVNFLDEALNQRSDEGSKAMIAQNVEQKASLVVLMQENRSQRKEMRSLQKRLKEQEEAFAALRLEHEARKQISREAGADSDDEPGEEQLDFIRGKVRAYELEVESLKKDAALRDAEQRRLANLLRVTGQRSLAENPDFQEDEAALYKDMYHAEQGRLETAGKQMRELQAEVSHLKHDRLTLKTRLRQETGVHSMVGSEIGRDQSDTRSMAGTTLVDQLRHENAELRREMGARSSLLVNRDREKERLQQEIEDMKHNLLRGNGLRSINGDSILDRSASRAFQRPGSRASANTYNTALSDAERDEYEQKNGFLRDCISGLRMEKQDLQQQLTVIIQERETLDQRLVEMEQDVIALSRQCDEVSADNMDKDRHIQEWEEEARNQVFELQDSIAQRDRAITDLEQQLRDADEVKEGHSLEYQKLSNQLHTIEMQQQNAVQRLRQEINELNVENESLINGKRSIEQYRSEIEMHNRHLNGQLDGLQGRQQYLQEDQDRNKSMISDLEAAVRSHESNIQAERARSRQLEQELLDERMERQRSSTQDKQQAVHEINDLRNALDDERNECLKLKTLLSTREMEVNHYKFKLEDLEGSLRESLGEMGSSKSSLIRSVEKLQMELDAALNQLEMVRGTVAERESHNRALESRFEEVRQRHQQLTHTYEQEKLGHKNLGRLHEQISRRAEKHGDEIAHYKSELAQLESSRREEARDKERLEAYYNDAIGERNNILLALWNRLSILCGQEWIQQNGSVNGRHVSPDVVASMFPAFSRAVIGAVKGVESLCGSFKQRIRQVEKDLWRDYSAVQHELLLRTTRMDKLEHSYRNQRNEARSRQPTAGGGAAAADSDDGFGAGSRVKNENRLLKAELASIRKEMGSRGLPGRPKTGGTLRHASETIASAAANGFGNSPSRSRFSLISAAPSAPTTAPSTSHGSPTMSPTRGGSILTDGTAAATAAATTAVTAGAVPAKDFTTGSDASDQRWIFRLKELERRLKAEREARLIDRSGARKRLEEMSVKQQELAGELEREREKSKRSTGSEEGAAGGGFGGEGER